MLRAFTSSFLDSGKNSTFRSNTTYENTSFTRISAIDFFSRTSTGNHIISARIDFTWEDRSDEVFRSASSFETTGKTLYETLAAGSNTAASNTVYSSIAEHFLKADP